MSIETRPAAGAAGTSRLVVEGRSVEDGGAVRVVTDGGAVAAIERLAPGAVDPELWLSAGWLDIQINGFGGFDPNESDARPETTAAMVRALWPEGVTGSCVTICTESEPHIVDCLRAIAAACDADPLVAASVTGIHVEGPFISPHDGPRGAHPLPHIRKPDVAEYRRWQEAAGGRIRIVTVSPEYDETPAFVAALAADGVVVSVGHTAANGDQIRRAVDAGARWSTHLGNGAHAQIARHPNYIWEQLAEDRLSAGFIFDGHHLPPSVMRAMARAKGVERTVLVSDALFVAGLPAGDYAMPDGTAVSLDANGRLALKGTPYLAGSASSLPDCVANAMRHAGMTLRDAVATVTTNPSRLLGLGVHAGHETLREGMRANLTAFRRGAGGELAIEKTVVDGTLVFDAGAAR